MEFQMLDQEFWYGGAVYEGYRQPVGLKDCVECPSPDSVKVPSKSNNTALYIIPPFF